MHKNTTLLSLVSLGFALASFVLMRTPGEGGPWAGVIPAWVGRHQTAHRVGGLSWVGGHGTPHWVGGLSWVGGQRPAAQPAGRLEIRLQRAVFDPLYETPDVPPHVTLDAYPGDGYGYYLVQFHGPILPEWKDMLQEEVVAVYDYVPQFAYIVRMDRATAARVRALDPVRWVGLYQPAFRLSTGLDGLVASAKPGEMVRVIVRSFAGEPAGALVEQFHSLGARVHAAGRDTGGGVTFELELAAGAITAVARLSGVAWIEPSAEPRLLNEIARGPLILDKDGVEAHLGLYGAGQIVVVGDTGVSSGDEASMHPDFQGHFYKGTWGSGSCGSWEDYHAHGTHVAGSVLGSGVMDGAVTATHSYAGTNAGIAPEAHLWAWGFCSDWSGLPDVDPYNDYYGVIYDDDPRARVNTNSWGYDDVGAGTYDAFSRETDRFIWDHPDMVVLFAASNAGVDAEPPDGVVDEGSLGVPAGAKNIITVGASESYRLSGGYNPGGACSTWGTCWHEDFPINPVRDDRLSDDPCGMVAFSSRGPARDGRLKPDIVAPGSNVASTRYQGGTDDPLWGVYDGWYSYCGGTSMATPLAAGASAIVREFYTVTYGVDPTAALVKATLINGAYDMTPGQYRDEDPAGAHDDVTRRPDVNQGWGRIDLYGTLVYTSPYTLWFHEHAAGLSIGQVYSTALTVTGDGHPLRVTLAWSDYPGAEAAHGALVNDLDLEIAAPGGTTYYGNDVLDGVLDGDVDHTNNVEGIDFASPVPGTYLIRVRAYNTPHGPQPFALVASGDMGAQGYLEGTVLALSSGDGASVEPLPDATVRAVTGTVVYVTTTDGSGAYTTTVYPDRYTVSAWKYGYTLETITDVVVLSDTVATANFTLTQTALYSLTGHITDSVTGDPLSATVSVFGPFGNPITQTASPQTSGYYAFTLPGGPYTVSAEARLHRAGAAFVNLTGDAVQNFALVATTTDGLLWGRVTRLETGQPLEGATIGATPASGVLTGTQSGPDGAYEMLLPHGTYTVVVSAPLYGTVVETDVVVPQSNLVARSYALPAARMALSPPGGISVTLQIGESVLRTLTISNAGSERLAFDAVEHCPGCGLPGSGGGGPDPFGYAFQDSLEPLGPLFEWIDATDGVPLGLLDDGEISLTLPFPFTFYGTQSTALMVGNNGGVLFDATGGDVEFYNQPLETPMTDDLIVPFWDDLSDETGDVYCKTVGQAPSRRFVIEWHDRPHWSAEGAVGSTTFELILYEGTDNLKLQYQDVVFGNAAYDYGASATVGIRGSGSNYLEYSYNTPVLTDGLSICFQYPGSPPCDPVDIPWLSTSPVSGVVAAGTSLPASVTFDAAAVPEPGDYAGVLYLYANDPEAQPYTVYPVTMTVVPPPFDFGVTLAPTMASQSARAGQTVTYTLRVSNTGETTETFAFDYEGSRWDVDLALSTSIAMPLSSTTLAAGAGEDLRVGVTVPVTAAVGASDSVTVSASYPGSLWLPGAGSRLTTTVAAAEWNVYLPLVMRSVVRRAR